MHVAAKQSQVQGSNSSANMKRNISKRSLNFRINLISFFPVLVLALSGLIIQFHYHMKGYPDHYEVWGFDRTHWLLLHKVCAVTCVLLILLHLYLHWNWLKMALTKRRLTSGKRIKKNSLWLSIVFMLATLTSVLSWLIIDDPLPAKHIIEIHDKLGIVLTILLINHIIQHFNWFIRLFQNKN
jgi:hypothetical protein